MSTAPQKSQVEQAGRFRTLGQRRQNSVYIFADTVGITAQTDGKIILE